MIRKMSGLLGMWVEKRGIVSSVLFSLGVPSSFNGIYKSLFILFFIKTIGYSCYFNDVFGSDNRFYRVLFSSLIRFFWPNKMK